MCPPFLADCVSDPRQSGWIRSPPLNHNLPQRIRQPRRSTRARIHALVDHQNAVGLSNK
jgi:hypothetical protein